jgi:E3 ubiquitin-protein ligase RBX1
MEIDSQSTKDKFTIKKWNAVTMWKWEGEQDSCAICRNHLMDICIECQANQERGGTDECNVAWGSCNHAFHFHCITRWLKKLQTCPLDNLNWEFEKYGK